MTQPVPGRGRGEGGRRSIHPTARPRIWGRRVVISDCRLMSGGRRLGRGWLGVGFAVSGAAGGSRTLSDPAGAGGGSIGPGHTSSGPTCSAQLSSFKDMYGPGFLQHQKHTHARERGEKSIPRPSSIGDIWVSTPNHKTRYSTPQTMKTV
jgi:hypothetical protein